MKHTEYSTEAFAICAEGAELLKRASFQLDPIWPPGFTPQLPSMMRASAEEAARSAASTARRRALLDSEDAEDRRRGARSLFGLSRAGDERISKART